MSTTSARRSLSPVPVAAREITLHGRPVAFLEAGADSGGPVVVLLHGLASSSQTWSGVLPLLGRHAHVIAPDLLGHGKSAKPRSGDYSLGAYAAGVRDLLITLELDRATVVGHSFGGGVAMQFAYQFPELAQRLVLVSSGGLGRAVNVALRAATLPGTSMVLRALPAISPPWLTRLARRVVPALDRPDLVGMASAVASFTDRGARGAFAQTVRGALNLSGQRLEGTERLYLLADVPVLLVGGSEDSVIPVEHTLGAHDLLPGSHLEIFDGAGHFPHVEQPVRFADLLMRFLTGTSAARSDMDSLRRRLQAAPSPAAG
ncbi:alpha/beta fold hydrolase [Pseudonocardia sp. DSM 110487]|jgi:pimeloyl-ACP methyl ester carboxylesterase|uniref:alpha/beta fold hydrolase n=1 Tax=Pseudonocardia sp. DSM 110487 TaxID=2865833 RepID=UPI001C6A724A|nr:alpha/beta fold hydrolase [Pseudonocardia sp. DSM 110487]QYN32323.1 alpha/beta fold hydrolase [Pseudonocardia sp. DSM 110487]